MGDTHDQSTTAGITKHVVSSGSPYFTMFDLMGSRLAPQVLGRGRLAGGIRIQEGGSSGGSSLHS